MKKWDIIENIKIEKLVFWGKGFARLNELEDNKVLFITGNPVPWAVVNLRILKKRNSYYETQIIETIKKSPIEIDNKDNLYGISGGWKWINIPYEEQLKIKETQIIESLFHIRKLQQELNFEPIIPSPLIYGYRNKIEFSFWKYLSNKYNIEEHFNVWFHKQWEFSKVEDFDWTPLIDELQNTIYRDIKKYSKTLWLPVYDQIKQDGFFRHILIRKTYFTDEIMLLLSFNPEYFELNKKINKQEKLDLIKEFLISLTKKYTQIKSIYFSHNPNKADTCIWDLELIYWKTTIKENLLDLSFNISPTSFFQTNSTWAEKLYSVVLDFYNPSPSNEGTSLNTNGRLNWVIVLDLYWWTGTIGMIFACAWAKYVYSVELEESASKDWEENAKMNWIKNIGFINSKVEDFLSKYLSNPSLPSLKSNGRSNWKADLLIIDPPRNWMHPKALEDILKFETNQIIYVSCNPATLSRDLEYILSNSNYRIEKIQPVDMFPHTIHIETVVSLIKK